MLRLSNITISFYGVALPFTEMDFLRENVTCTLTVFFQFLLPLNVVINKWWQRGSKVHYLLPYIRKSLYDEVSFCGRIAHIS